MNRRELLKLSVMATLAGGSGLHAATAVPGSRKKGIGLGFKNPHFAKLLKELRCNWFYSWGARYSEKLPDGTPYVPMIFRYRGDKRSIAEVGRSAKRDGAKELLGFNEPDGAKQANMSVEEALNAWPILEKTKLRLGSPACVHPDNDWMKAFMAGVKKQKLRVDFICVHSYGAPNALALVRSLEKIHKLYRKPIWITELGVGDWQAKSPAQNRHKPETVLRFMEEILPKFEQLDFLERYAWFPSLPKSAPLGSSALFDDRGNLTRLGECYRDC